MISDNIAYNSEVVLDITLSLNTITINISFFAIIVTTLFQVAPLVGAISAGNCCVVKPSELMSNIERLLHGDGGIRTIILSLNMYIVGVLCTTNTNPITHRLTT